MRLHLLENARIEFSGSVARSSVREFAFLRFRGAVGRRYLFEAFHQFGQAKQLGRGGEGVDRELGKNLEEQLAVRWR